MMFATTPAASPPTTTFEVLMAMLLLRLGVKVRKERGVILREPFGQARRQV